MMTLRIIEVNNGDWENPGEAIDEGFDELREAHEQEQHQQQKQQLYVYIKGIYEIASSEEQRERLCQLLKQAAPSMTKLAFAPTERIPDVCRVEPDYYETRMPAQVPQRILVEHFVQILSAIPQEYRRILESLKWDAKLNIRGNLPPLATVLGSLTGLEHFTSCHVIFSGNSSDDPKERVPQILARQLRDLPKLKDVFWSGLPYQHVEMGAFLCQSKSLEKLFLLLGKDDTDGGDDTNTSGPTADSFRRFCQAFQKSNIRRLELHRINGRLSETNFQDLASAIGNHTALEEALLPGEREVSYDPFVKAVVQNTHLVRFQVSNPSYYHMDITKVSAKSLDMLIQALESSNYTLQYFELPITEVRRLDRTCQQKLKTIDLYCQLNRNFPRKRILTDETFMKHDFVNLLPRDNERPGLQHSLCFLLLRSKPALWLPSFHNSNNSNNSSNHDNNSESKLDRKRKAPSPVSISK